MKSILTLTITFLQLFLGGLKSPSLEMSYRFQEKQNSVISSPVFLDSSVAEANTSVDFILSKPFQQFTKGQTVYSHDSCASILSLQFSILKNSISRRNQTSLVSIRPTLNQHLSTQISFNKSNFSPFFSPLNFFKYEK